MGRHISEADMLLPNMKAFIICITLPFFAISNAEVLENPHSRPANWDPEKIKKVELTQRTGTQNNGVNQLQVNIIDGNYYCSLFFGGQPWRSVLSNHELQG